MTVSSDMTKPTHATGARSGRVVVIGAGITGLTAAFTLATHHPGIDVIVLEASDRVGGKILTTPFAGHPVDCGADAFLARVPDARDLCAELGLSDVLASPVERSALVWTRGALRRLPAGLVLGVPTDLDALTSSGIVSPAGVERARLDLDVTEWPQGAPPQDPEGHGDMSVGELVRGRLGDEVFERLVAPLLSGVNAGDADQLSVAAGAGQLAGAARAHPSLITALRAQAQTARDAQSDPDAPVFFGLPVGTQTLTDLLLSKLTAAGVPVHLHCPATSLSRAGSGWSIATPLGNIDADRVILATPGPIAGRLLAGPAPITASHIAELDYASVAMVTLAVRRTALGHPLDASGFLVAKTDQLPTLTACSWASTKWAHLADPNVAILRVSAGRFGDTAALELDDHDLVAALSADLTTTMGLTEAPIEARVTRWVDALPQFLPGHLGRIRAWRAELAESAPGVTIAGAAYDGLGLPACIRQGRQAALDAA